MSNLNLPYSTTAIQFPMYTVNPNTIPQHTPPPLLLEMQNVYPQLVAGVISEVQNKASTNILRVFMTNAVLDNNYNNHTFSSLMDCAVKLLYLNCAQSGMRSYQHMIPQAAATACEYICMININLYPALQQLIDGQTLNAVQTQLLRINEAVSRATVVYQQVLNQETTMGNQMMRQPIPQQPYGNQYGQQPFTHQPMNQPYRPQMAGPSMGSSGVFRSAMAPSQVVSHATANADPRFDRFSIRSSGDKNQVQSQSNVVQSKPQEFSPNISDERLVRYMRNNGTNVQQTNVPVPVAQQPELNKNIDDVLSSTSNETNERKLITAEDSVTTVAFDPSVYKSVVEKDGSCIKQYLIELKKDPNTMDKNKHFTPPSINTKMNVVTIPAEGEFSDARITETVVNFNEGNYRENKDLAELEGVDPPDNVMYINAIQLTNSLQETFNEVNIALAIMSKKDEVTSNIVIHHGVRYDGIVTKSDIKEFIKFVTMTRTFETMQRYLKLQLRGIKENGYAELDRATFIKVNKRLTDSLNRFVRFEMGLPSGWIDSFVEDAGDVLDFIDKRYGKTFRNRLSHNQEEIISRAFRFNNDYLENVKFDELEDDNAKDVNVAYMSYPYIMCGTELLLTELGFDIPDINQSSFIAPDQTPLISLMANEMVKFRDPSVGYEKERLYIKTADDVLLEIINSKFDPEKLLIRVVSPAEY